MARAQIQTHGESLELEYELLPPRGDVERGETVVLVHGLGCQMIQWPPGIVSRLRKAGYQVLRFDNRDVGLSSALKHHKPQKFSLWDLTRWRFGARLPAPYSIADMAQDCMGLLDHLALDRVHLVGVSMGGMISQEFAIRHPERLKSLTVIMSSTAGRNAGYPTAEVLKSIFTPPKSRERNVLVDYLIGQWRRLQGPAYPTPAEDLRPLAEQCIDRAQNPAGFLRQMQAIMNAANRSKRLGKVTTPTLVMHGSKDPLVHVSGGKAVAKAIPGAQLVLIDGWGHDLPAALHETLCEKMLTHFKQCDAEIAA